MVVANDPIVRVTTVTTTPDLAALAALPRRTSRPATTWSCLVEREPRLAELLAEIEGLAGEAPDWCAIAAWFGPRQCGGGYKDRMTALVGWGAERDDPLLRTHEAYRAAYRILYDALPPCGDCPCGAVARVLYGTATGEEGAQ